MTITRRSFIRIVGSTAVIAGATGGAWLATRTPSAALRPWERAGTDTFDPRVHALSYAVLAPNPHNRQPWQVDLSQSGEATLFCDPERLLPETDPFNRQIVIGLGCFIEVAAIAAAETGHRLVVEPFPNGADPTRLDRRPVARLRFVNDSAPQRDPLFAHILQRRSNKEPFDTGRPVPAHILADLRTATAGNVQVEGTVSDARVARLRELTWAAMETELRTPAAYLESVHLMRIGRAEIERNPDGISLDGPMLETLHVLGALTRQRLANMSDPAYQRGFKRFEPIIRSAMGHIWVVTPTNDRTAQLAAGRAYVRLNLKATGLGLDMHPLSQCLQEYQEMLPKLDAIHREIGVAKPARVQMLARLGYGERIGPTPRWPLHTRLVRT